MNSLSKRRLQTDFSRLTHLVKCPKRGQGRSFKEVSIGANAGMRAIGTDERRYSFSRDEDDEQDRGPLNATVFYKFHYIRGSPVRPKLLRHEPHRLVDVMKEDLVALT